MQRSQFISLLFALAASVTAASGWAQYSVTSTGPITGSCVVNLVNNRTEFTINAPGTTNLAASSNNLVVVAGSDSPYFAPSTLPPGPGGSLPMPIPWYVYGVTTPVSMGISFYPAINGTLTGTGFGGQVRCDNGTFSVPKQPRVVSAETNANYFVSYSGTVIGGACTTTNISGSINGDVFLPPLSQSSSSDNFIVYTSINSGPAAVTFGSFNPASDSGNYPFSYDIPATSIPYSITGTAYPARNGVPVGTGVKLTYYCNEGGVLTSSPPQAVRLPTKSIPVLSAWGMLILSGILILTVWIARRQS
jgi:hypothetical protein